MSDEVTLSKRRTVPVVGMTFRDGYPDNLLTLRGLEEATRESEPVPVILIRDPNNPADPNAVQVHVPALGNQSFIGFLSRDNAARIAPRLDAGAEFRAYVNWVRVQEGHEDRPGVDITIQRVEREEA